MVRPFGGTWPVELKYKELKSRFAMEEFSGATATSIIQEFYINMPLSNLVSLIKNNADEEIDITSKSSNKLNIVIRLIAHLSSDGSRSSFQRFSVVCLNSQLLRSCTKKLSGAVHRSFPEDHFQEKN